MLYLVGFLYYCINDARSHKHKKKTVMEKLPFFPPFHIFHSHCVKVIKTAHINAAECYLRICFVFNW